VLIARAQTAMKELARIGEDDQLRAKDFRSGRSNRCKLRVNAAVHREHVAVM